MLGDREVQGIRLAALVHDVGKIGVPTELLLKPGHLRPAEMALICEHVAIGEEVMSTVDFPWPIGTIIGQHHERFDGSGYPARAEGRRDPARSADHRCRRCGGGDGRARPYRQGMGKQATIDHLLAERGKLFDAAVVNACVDVMKAVDFVL